MTSIIQFKPPVEVISFSSSDDDSYAYIQNQILNSINYSNSDERQIAIRQEIIEDSLCLQDDEIILIDDEYNDDLSVGAELADTSIIDEFFGDDTLLKEFKAENDARPSGSYRDSEERVKKNSAENIITCPICWHKLFKQFKDLSFSLPHKEIKNKTIVSPNVINKLID